MSFCIKSLNIVSSESDVHKVNEFQYRFVGTYNTKKFVDHVSDLSSSKKSIDFLGVLLFQIDFVSLSSRCGLGVQCRSWDDVSLWSTRTFSSRPHSELPNYSRKPRHCIRWMVRHGTHFSVFFFFFKKKKTTANC